MPVPTPTEYYIELGRMVSRFNRFEYWLPVILSKILDIHQGLCSALVAGENTTMTLRMMKSTALLRSDDRKKRDEIRSLMNRAMVLCERRGSFIHATTLFNEEHSIAKQIKVKRHNTKAISFINEDIDIEELKKLTIDIDLVFDEMIEVFKDFEKLPHTKILTIYDDKEKRPKGEGLKK